jgi:hypothetical protein
MLMWGRDTGRYRYPRRLSLMADVNSRTEDRKSLPWKSIQRNVFHLQKRIYQAARQKVPMTKARILKSHVRGKCAPWYALRE